MGAPKSTYMTTGATGSSLSSGCGLASAAAAQAPIPPARERGSRCRVVYQIVYIHIADRAPLVYYKDARSLLPSGRRTQNTLQCAREVESLKRIRKPTKSLCPRRERRTLSTLRPRTWVCNLRTESAAGTKAFVPFKRVQASGKKPRLHALARTRKPDRATVVGSAEQSRARMSDGECHWLTPFRKSARVYACVAINICAVTSLECLDDRLTLAPVLGQTRIASRYLRRSCP